MTQDEALIQAQHEIWDKGPFFQSEMVQYAVQLGFEKGVNYQKNLIWHNSEDKPECNKYIIVYSTDNGVYNGLASYYLDHWSGIKKWTYLSNILPDKNIYE